MRALAMTAIVMSFISAPTWAADPAGSYRVNGSNPNDGSSYSGTVTVEKTGDTYKVTWVIAGKTFTGTGIGDNRFIAVSYRSGNAIGLALYGDAGSDWQGIWTYDGGTKTGTENWSRQ